jgi:hypothetical protein
LNQVERFFALITGQMTRRGTFRSAGEFEQAIYKWLAESNRFRSLASADVVLDKPRSCKE